MLTRSPSCTITNASVHSTELKQFIVCTPFDDPSVLQYYDQIGILDRRNAMGNHEGRLPALSRALSAF